MNNVIYLCSTLERTGPTNQLFNIISNLDPSMYKAMVITLSPESSASFMGKFIQQGVNVRTLGLKRCVSQRKLLQALVIEFEKYQPDIVHSQGIRADNLMSMVRYPVKKIATLRNIPYLDYPMTYGWLMGKIMAYTHLKALNKIDQPVTVSYGVQKELVSKFSCDLKVIHNGVDHNFFNPKLLCDNEIDSLKSILAIDKLSKVLVYTGVLESRKQLELLFDLVQQSTGIKLLVVGDGVLKDKLSAHEAVTNGKVIMCGAVSDVRHYLAIADGFVSLSSAEGLPNSLIEALMMGLPVLASDIEPHKELIVDSSIPIKLFDIQQPSLISNFLNSDLNEWLSESHSFDIRHYTIEYFSAKAMSEDYQKIYMDLLT